MNKLMLIVGVVGCIAPSVRSETVDLATEGDVTVSDKSSVSYTNSGDELRTLSFGVGKWFSYSGDISGNIKVRVYATGARKDVAVTSAVCSHTGGTFVESNILNLSPKGTIGFGSKPITVSVSDTATSGQVVLSQGNTVLTNDLVIVGTADCGRQTAQSTIRDLAQASTAYGTGFSGSVNATGCAGFAINQNHEHRVAGREMNFTGPINAAGANVYLAIVTNGCINFKNDMTATLLDCSLYTAACRRGEVVLAAGRSYAIGTFALACHNATVNGKLGENCILSWVAPGMLGLSRSQDLAGALQLCDYHVDDGASGVPVGVYTLGTDQTVNCLTSVVVTAEQAALPGMVLTGVGRTVTLKSTQERADCYARVNGSLSLVLNAENASNRQSFFARTNETTGAIGVQKGIFEIGEGAVFPNITGVTIGSAGTLEVNSGLEDPIPSGIDLNVTGGATISVGQGVSLKVARVFVDGVQKAKSQLSACGVTVLGDLVVMDEPMVQEDGTWTSATSGEWSETANWRDGVLPTGNASTATLAAAGSETDDPVVIDIDSDVSLGTVVADGSSYRTDGSSTLALGRSGHGGVVAVSVEDGRLEVRNPVVSAGPFVGVNDFGSDPDHVGRVVWSTTSFGSDDFGTAAVFTSAGVADFPTAGSLGFVTDVANLLIGHGTARYSGAEDASICGLTVYDTGKGGGIVDVANKNVTLTVTGPIVTGEKSVVNALSKYGAGRLVLLGDSRVGGTTGQVGAELELPWKSTYSDCFGAAANGTGPTNGVASLNAIGGILQVGDAEHAPVVEMSHGLIIGSRAYRAGVGLDGQEGHFVLSNGTVTVKSGTATLGYYGPQVKSDGSYPTVSYTQQAGTFTVNDTFRVGFAYNANVLQSNMKFTLNGGSFSCTRFEVGNASSSRPDVSADIVINGGILSVAGDFTSQDRNNGTRAVFVGNGGSMEIGGAVHGYCGGAYDSSRYPTLFTFNSGFVLKTARFVGRDNVEKPNRACCNVYFDGGIWEQPLSNAAFGGFCPADTVEAKMGGFYVALTNDAEKTCSLALDAKVSGDGGLVFHGPGFASFGADFTNSTCKGGVTVRDDATLLAGADAFQNLSVTVASAGALRAATGTVARFGNLTLGTADASDAACVQMTAGASLKIAGDLKVVSPVVFKVASSDLPNASLSGATLFSGFTIDSATMSSYDRSFFRLDEADCEAGYRLCVRRTQTSGGCRLSISIAERGGLILLVK